MNNIILLLEITTIIITSTWAVLAKINKLNPQPKNPFDIYLFDDADKDSIRAAMMEIYKNHVRNQSLLLKLKGENLMTQDTTSISHLLHIEEKVCTFYGPLINDLKNKPEITEKEFVKLMDSIIGKISE